MGIDYAKWEREKPVTDRAAADKIFAGGCRVPGCAHDHANQPLYIHAGCHISGRIQVAYYNGHFYVSCQECGGFIARFEIK